jgi:hypothetical protein
MAKRHKSTHKKTKTDQANGIVKDAVKKNPA